MINGHLEQFLDTGWMTEATLYYRGRIYWFEVQSDDNNLVFVVDSWNAKNEDDLFYHSIINADGTIFWKREIELHGTNLDLLKKSFLETPVFAGKTFWEVESELVWLEEADPVVS